MQAEKRPRDMPFEDYLIEQMARNPTVNFVVGKRSGGGFSTQDGSNGQKGKGRGRGGGRTATNASKSPMKK